MLLTTRHEAKPLLRAIVKSVSVVTLQSRLGVIPTYVRQIAGEDSATLVRGSDAYHHFELEPRPTLDMEPGFVALHKRIAERNAQILYRGTPVKSYNDPTAQAERGAN